jgi:signal transduction histidine kinase
MRARKIVVRAISVVGLAALVVAVHLIVVLGVGHVPTSDQRTLLVASMAAAGVTALLYVPLNRRLNEVAAHVLFGRRGSPSDVLRSFGSRLTRPLPLDELLLQVTESLRATFALESAEVWTGSAGVLERAASDPDAGPRRVVLNRDEQVVVAQVGASGPVWTATWLPYLMEGRADADVRVFPATHAGELLGMLVAVPTAAGRPFTDADADVVLALARQIGLALHNVRLGSALEASLDDLRRQAHELRASRSRIVAAGDAERRRIERDLHDGAQSQLYALAVNVKLARELAESDPSRARGVLEQLSVELEQALDQFRDLARGIYPTVLADRGLVDGLRAAVSRAMLPVRLDAEARRRYPTEVEATVYFCCLEALQNAGRHAGAGASATVHVWEDDGRLRFVVADDGTGFDMTARRDGAGLVNLGDRVGALGGELAVRSSPGHGTTVEGAVPL